MPPKIKTYQPGPPGGASYRPKPVDAAGRVKPREKRIYDRRAWRGSDGKVGCRDLKLQRNPLCERCLIKGDYVEATDVHHRIDVKAEPSLAFDLANLESLCHECHSRETAERLHHEPPSQA